MITCVFREDNMRFLFSYDQTARRDRSMFPQNRTEYVTNPNPGYNMMNLLEPSVISIVRLNTVHLSA